MKKYIQNYYITIFLIIIFFIIIYHIFQYSNKEAFGLDDFNKIGDGLKQVGNIAREIPNEIKGIGNGIENIGRKIEGSVLNVTSKIDNTFNDVKNEVTSSVKVVGDTAKKVSNEIDDKLTNFAKEIETQTKRIVIDKIKNFFLQLGDILNKGLIDPFKSLFLNLGDVFVQLIEILKLIISKIVSLPGCIFYYMLGSINNVIYSFFDYIFPDFLMNFFITIYNWTLNPILNYTGYNDASRKCYSFNVDKNVDKMNDNFKNISNSFNKGFGQLNFNSIRL